MTKPSASWYLLLGLNLACAIGCGREEVPLSDTDRSRGESQSGRTLLAPDRNRDWRAKVESVRNGDTQRIEVEQYAVTPELLDELLDLHQLRELVLDQGVIEDSTIHSHISQLDLFHLRARFSGITDSGLHALLESQKNLKVLNLPQCQVTSNAFRNESQSLSLTFLRLGGTGIDDACLEGISKLPKLRHLHLLGPKLTDRSLKFIAEMQVLESFYLDDCKLSDGAWEELFRGRPKLHVHIDQAHHDRDPHPLHDDGAESK